MSTTTVREKVSAQFEAMIGRGRMPCFELEMSINGQDEYLLVDLTVNSSGVAFQFDSMGLPVYFDGEIVTINDNAYYIPFDEYFDNLDHYLEAIYANIGEGFLCPNNLYRTES